MTHENFRSCIEACNACADAGNHCAKACLFEQSREDLARCISLDVDCAEICQLAAAYMARNSELVGEMCSFCAEVCISCAEECEKHEMAHCLACAEACRRCARECFNVLAVSRAPAKSTQPRPGAH